MSIKNKITLLFVFFIIGLTTFAIGCKSKSLLSIYITPINSKIHIFETQAFTATAVYSNGTTENVTKNAQWFSSDETVAIFVSAKYAEIGIATAGGLGTSEITAVFNGLQSNVALLSVMPQYAYISNIGSVSPMPTPSPNVTRCLVNINTGQFYDCANDGVQGFNGSTGIAVQTVNALPYIYASNNAFGTGTTVSQRLIDPNTGFFVSGTEMPQTFDGPAGIVLHHALNSEMVSTLYAYVANNSSSTVSKCTVNDETGIFDICVDSGFYIPAGAPSAFALTLSHLHMDSGEVYFYIADNINLPPPSAFIIKCLINKFGNMGNCTAEDTSSAGTEQSIDLGFININNTQYAYVTQGAGGTISVCEVSMSNGSLINCKDAPYTGIAPFSPFAVNFLNAGNTIYAYFTNPSFFGGSDLVYQCEIDTDQNSSTYLDLINCQNSGAAGLAGPIDIAFY